MEVTKEKCDKVIDAIQHSNNINTLIETDAFTKLGMGTFLTECKDIDMKNLNTISLLIMNLIDDTIDLEHENLFASIIQKYKDAMKVLIPNIEKRDSCRKFKQKGRCTNIPDIIYECGHQVYCEEHVDMANLKFTCPVCFKQVYALYDASGIMIGKYKNPKLKDVLKVLPTPNLENAKIVTKEERQKFFDSM